MDKLPRTQRIKYVDSLLLTTYKRVLSGLTSYSCSQGKSWFSSAKSSAEDEKHKALSLADRAAAEYNRDVEAARQKAEELKKEGKDYLNSAKGRVEQVAEDAKDQVSHCHIVGFSAKLTG